VAGPRFSIITPYLDQERYLDAAIRSVIAQDMPDWELLLFDDGSRDGGPAIAAAHAARDRRIRALTHADGRNHGAAHTRNRALEQARGEWIAFLDGDDLYHPDRLSAHLALAQDLPGIAAVCGRTRWFREGVGTVHTEHFAGLEDSIVAPPLLVERLILDRRGDVPATCSVSFRREAVLAAGGFEESFALYEDQALFAALFARHATIVTSHCGADYRQHPDSTCARAEQASADAVRRLREAERRFLGWVASQDWARPAANPALARALAWSLRRFDGSLPLRVLAKLRLRILRLSARLAWGRAARQSPAGHVRRIPAQARQAPDSRAPSR
jgi:glycosyltransferase involved in cell wall biosynthesis